MTNQDVSEQERTLVDVTLIDMGIIWRYLLYFNQRRKRKRFHVGRLRKKVYITLWSRTRHDL